MTQQTIIKIWAAVLFVSIFNVITVHFHLLKNPRSFGHDLNKAKPHDGFVESSLMGDNGTLHSIGNEHSNVLSIKSSLTNTTRTSNNNNTNSRFAYVYLMAGCIPSSRKLPAYLGYMYNIMISKRILLERGSKQDVFVLIRMHEKTDYTKLPPEEESLFTKAGVKFMYLPKVKCDNFHTAMMAKFNILNLTQYERVMYLDSDVMPIWNMDYLFLGSVGSNAVIAENLIIAYKGEPASGGFFMLRPDEKDFLEIRAVIDKQHNSYETFDEKIGWGHKFTPEDPWRPYKNVKGWQNGTLWNWYGAFSDQGLLYYWTKYYKKNVSIIIRDKVQRWSTNDHGDAILVSEANLNEIFGLTRPKRHTIVPTNHDSWNHPYCDFEHFTTINKPWLQNQISKYHTIEHVDSVEGAHSPKQLWYHVLRLLIKEYELRIEIDKLKIPQPSLGLFQNK